MKRSGCAAALFLMSTAASSLADDLARQTKTPPDIAFDTTFISDLTTSGLAADADKRGKADKQAKADRDKKADKKAKEPWDISFGTALLSEYNFRGISASDHRPAVSTYFEPHYDFSRSLEAYAHVETNSLTFPTYAAPAVELYGGVRPTFDRLALDFGLWEHWLPGGRCFNFQAPGGLCIPQLTVPYVNSLPADISFWEVYGKAAYDVDRRLSFGGEVYWTPTVMNSGAEATYVAGWVRYVLPPILPKDFSWFISGEAGHWFRDTSPYPSYTNWNAGLAFIWKQFTLDLRYSSTDHRDCIVPVVALDHTSNVCGSSFLATLAVDLTKANLMVGEEPSKADKKNKGGQVEPGDEPAGEGSRREGREAAKTPWDIAFGGALMSDYNFRGISASNHKPAAAAYVEPRYDFSRNLQAYVNVTTNSLTLPNSAPTVTEIYGGVRPTFDRLALDFGFWEHWFPTRRCFNFQAPGGLCIPELTVPYVNSLPADISFWEVYGMANYPVDRQLSFGGGVYWTPSVLNSGAAATYVAGWSKYVLPPIFPKDFGWFFSAAAGHWFRDASPFPSYTNWNVGLAFTWKQFTLDFRYSDADRHDCAGPMALLDHTSNRCGASFIATLAVDLTAENLKPPSAIPIRGH